MTDEKHGVGHDQRHADGTTQTGKKRYRKPVFSRLGDLRDVTMGSTGDTFESGTTRFPGP